MTFPIIIPMLGVFKTDSPTWIGLAVLELAYIFALSVFYPFCIFIGTGNEVYVVLFDTLDGKCTGAAGAPPGIKSAGLYGYCKGKKSLLPHFAGFVIQ